ncbi:MAG: M36 family metallopeptidase [Acidobacteria bacterium]|nr:M36 family metallopeptidase [Acidobacteriota bacterium]
MLPFRFSRKFRFSIVAVFTAVLTVSMIVFDSSGSRFEASLTSRAASFDVGHARRSPNYDIREDNSAAAQAHRASARSAVGKTPAELAEIGNSIDRGAASLTAKAPYAKIEFNSLYHSPAVIGTDTWAASAEFLSGPSGGLRAETLRRFVSQNSELFGIDHRQTETLVSSHEYSNPDGVLSFAGLEQRVNGIPVFQGEIKAGFTNDGRLIRVINGIVPGVESGSMSADFGEPINAVRSAAGHIGHSLRPSDAELDKERSSISKIVFGRDDWATTAEKFYFPTEAGVAVPAWRVLFWLPHTAYYVIVDAANGSMLWRKDLAEDQSLTATFNVYGNATSPLKTADSPTPFSPGCTDPNLCPSPPVVQRSNFTLVGNEAPEQFNDIGWIPDAGLPVRMPPNPNITDGNNVEAGLDRDGTQGVDPTGHAVGDPFRVFSYVYIPAPGDPPPGEPPSGAAYRNGVITHGFYAVNRWHDELYKLGFTEQAGNFQHFNFGRGGSEGDRVSLEIQDSSGSNSANHAVPADGGRSRLQSFLWTLSTPNRDGTLDSTVLLHEMTHGLSNRLHGNTSGLSSNMARGMGEGWSDFYPLALLSLPTDAPCGTYAIGSYITFGIVPGTANYYYGLRRYPVAKISCLGPGALPHNPLTFRNLNVNSCTNLPGSFPPGPLGSGTCDQVHNAGEIWAVTLWEARGVLIEIHGAVEGNRRMLQYTTDGMKLSPLNPTFLQARDAIIAAAQASGGTVDANAVREGFRRRGLGFSASIQAITPAAVTEAFDLAPSQIRSPFDFDGDGSTDISVYRPSEGNWYLQRSTQGFAAVNWGIATDKVVPADYDGDFKTDIAVFRKGENSTWYILNSGTNTVRILQWGANNLEQAILFDTVTPADYDGDGKADPAVWRLTDDLGEPARFLILQSSNGQARVRQWGLLSDVPVPADYDGDQKADLAIFRAASGQWWIEKSTNSSLSVLQFGTSGDKAVPGDYTGDVKADIAVWRPTSGEWFVLRSENNSYFAFPFGISSDLPVPGDYDGDGKYDAAVFRLSNSVWYANRSTAGIRIQQFGLNGDMPLPNAYIR